METTYRQQQAQATRDRIAAAARDLFREKGYVATTVAAVAERAGIPVQTVYSALGSKARILLEVARLAVLELGEDDDEVPGDAEAGLRHAARRQRLRYDAMYDVVDVYLQAARTDPEIADVVRAIRGGQEQELRGRLEAIAGALRPGLDPEEALDRWTVLVLPEIYRTLVLERGRSADRYEQWLGDQLVAQLIG